jgi:hypothetical protein
MECKIQYYENSGRAWCGVHNRDESRCLRADLTAVNLQLSQLQQMASRVTEPCSCPEFCVYHARKNFDDLKLQNLELQKFLWDLRMYLDDPLFNGSLKIHPDLENRLNAFTKRKIKDQPEGNPWAPNRTL